MSGVVEPSIVVLPLVVRLIVVQLQLIVIADPRVYVPSIPSVVDRDVGLQGVGWSQLTAWWRIRLSRRRADEG